MFRFLNFEKKIKNRQFKMNSAKGKKGLTITDFFQKIKKMDRNKNIPKEDSEVVEAIVDLTIEVEAKVSLIE